MFLSLLIFAILPLACFSNPLFTFREENRVARADDESSLRLTELKNALKEKGFGCSVCMTFANVLQDLFVRNATEEEIVKKITSLCIKFKIEDELVCTAVVIEFKNEVLFIFDKVALSPEELCGILLGSDCGKPYDPWNQPWKVRLPDVPKPPVKPVKPPKPGSPVTNVLYLSDIHFDENYTVGLNAECGEPLCCRPPNGLPPVGKRAAGKWGDYNCDCPLQTLENLLQHLQGIKDQFEWIYMTGDIPAHNVWNQTKEEQLYLIEEITYLLKKYFPDKIVYPAVGNHESAPTNSFPPPFITGSYSNQWLRDALAKYWSTWLPADTAETIKKGGYYTAQIRKGLRVVSLNMNYCYKLNWWLLINSTDPAQQLSWLANILQKAEDEGEKVHIIGHVSPGSGDCLKTFSWQYYDIINRYESTVVNQFFGHAHVDYFEMFYDLKNRTRATNIAFVGPSVTTYTGLNPGYRIYTIDGDYTNSTQVVLNHVTYYMNLTKANSDDRVDWVQEYNAKDDYKMKASRPEDWNQVVQKFETDDNLFQKFYQYHYKMHPPQSYCDAKCKAGFLCSLKSGRSHDGSFCSIPPGSSYKELQTFINEIHKC